MKDIFIVVFRNLKDIPKIINILQSLPEILLYLLADNKGIKEVEVNEESVTQDKLKVMILNKLKTLWNEAKKWSWKNQVVFIKMVPELSEFFKLDSYNEYFIDALLDALKSGNKVTKREIMHSICKLLTINYHIEKRMSTFKTITELAESTSYYDRENYLIFCDTALNYFSLSLFKKLKIIDRYFELMNDKVSNIKLKAISIAIPLWRFAGDLYCQEIKERLHNLRNDKNKEVRQYADSALSLLQTKAGIFKKEETLIAERNAQREAAENDLERREEQEKEEQKKPKKEEGLKVSPKVVKKAHTIHLAVKSSFGKTVKEAKSEQKKSRGPSGTLCPVVTKNKKIKSFIDTKTPQLGKGVRRISDTDNNAKGPSPHKKSK